VLQKAKSAMKLPSAPDLLWLALNLAAPILLPVLAILFVKATPIGARQSIMGSMKDGQLCWYAITLSFAMCYDLIENTKCKWWAPYAMLGALLVCFFSGLFVAAAGLQPTPALPDGAGLGAWLWHYRVFFISVGFCGVAAYAAAAIHFALATHC
jgi:hypothetical protein